MQVAVFAVRKNGETESRPVYVVPNAENLDDAERLFQIELARKPGRYKEPPGWEYVDMGQDAIAELMKIGDNIESETKSELDALLELVS